MVRFSIGQKTCDLRFLDKYNYHLFFWPSGYGGDFVSSLYTYNLWRQWFDEQDISTRQVNLHKIKPNTWKEIIAIRSSGGLNQISGNTYRVWECYLNDSNKHDEEAPRIERKLNMDWWLPHTNLISGHWEYEFEDAFENSFFKKNKIKFNKNYRIICDENSKWYNALIDLAYIKRTSGNTSYEDYANTAYTQNNWTTEYPCQTIEYDYIFEDYGWEKLFNEWGMLYPMTKRRKIETQQIVVEYQKRNKKVLSAYKNDKTIDLEDWVFPPHLYM